MGFINKLGHFVEDAASFAIPAGLALAGTVATGGLGAIAAPTLLSALGAGAGGFARNEEEERRKKMLAQQARNQHSANLVNVLSPGTNAQAAQAEVPKSGFLETSSRGVGQGIQAFQAAQRLARQNEALDIQQEAAQDSLNRGRLDDLRQEGRDRRSSGQGLGAIPDDTQSGGFSMGPIDPTRSSGYFQADREIQQDKTQAEQAAERLELLRQRVGLRGDEIANRKKELNLASEAATQRGIAERNKRVSTLMASAIDKVAGGLGPDAGISLFTSQLRQEQIELKEEDLDAFVSNMSLAVPALKLEGEAKTRFARLASIEDATQRIRDKVLSAEPERFELFNAAMNTASEGFLQGRLTEKQAQEILAIIGLTSEMTVRVFSGAAITEDEFDRFSNNFIGGLVGGRGALLTRLNNVETEFRTQRENIVNTARDPEGFKAGIGALDDVAVLNQALMGDPAARDEIVNNRPELINLLEQSLGQGAGPPFRAPPGASFKPASKILGRLR